MTTNRNQSTDHAVADAALESVAAEHRPQARGASDVPGRKSDSTEKRIADLEQQAREADDRALRSHAELENYRKRAARELADERKYAVVPLVRDLLPVVDNLERAIEAANMQIQRVSEGSAGSTASDLSHLLDGVKMVATH